MKKVFAIILSAVIMSLAFSGCSFFGIRFQPKTETESTSAQTTETTTATQAPQTTTQEIKTTDEFPTEDDSEEFIEPQGRWKVTLPDVWDSYGDIIVSDKGDNVRFVYEEAYEEYGAGHVFTICTNKASDKEDMTNFPHAKEIYLDKNIQIYVMYPTDVQFGGIDGSKIDEQSEEYSALYNSVEDIIKSLEVLV